MTSSRKALLFMLAGSAALLTAAPASAENSGVLSSSWQQQSRADAIAANVGSPQYFAFELRFGPYWPRVDSEPGLEGKPYETLFGTGPQFYFGLEADFLPLRIPYVGLIGPGFGLGFTTVSAGSLLTMPVDPKANRAAEQTSLSIMPMYAAAVLRADELMRRTGVPLVPYAKFGFGFALWRASKGTGVSTYADEKAGLNYIGAGNSAGIHLALGGMLSLNFLDPRSALRLDESTGVNHIYLFGEWMNSILGNFGSHSMRVGTSTVVGGLALDI